MALTGGATLTRYAKQVGLGEFGFGILAAIPFLAAGRTKWRRSDGGNRRQRGSSHQACL